MGRAQTDAPRVQRVGRADRPTVRYAAPHGRVGQTGTTRGGSRRAYAPLRAVLCAPLRPTSPQLCGGTRAAPCGSSPHIVYTEAGGAIGENKGLRLGSALVVSALGVPDGATTRQQPRRDRSAEEIALARRFFRSATRRACRCTRALPWAPRGQIRSNKRP